MLYNKFTIYIVAVIAAVIAGFSMYNIVYNRGYNDKIKEYNALILAENEITAKGYQVQFDNHIVETRKAMERVDTYWRSYNVSTNNSIKILASNISEKDRIIDELNNIEPIDCDIDDNAFRLYQDTIRIITTEVRNNPSR